MNLAVSQDQQGTQDVDGGEFFQGVRLQFAPRGPGSLLVLAAPSAARQALKGGWWGMVADVVVVGSGVVGTATGKGLSSAGHRVTFVDRDLNRVASLTREGYTATDSLRLPERPAFVFLTLPTPTVGHRYELGVLSEATSSVGRELRHATCMHTVVLRSTVPPGTCEGLVQPLLERASGKSIAEGFALASNPEFLRAASSLEDFLHPWVTVIASRSRRTRERLQALLSPFGGEMRCFENPALAELIKCAHNVFNAAKISFWNEIWFVSELLGLDANEVGSTVATSAEGSFNPNYGIHGGAPFGGGCLPKDLKGFIGFAAELGASTQLLSAVDAVNERMLDSAHQNGRRASEVVEIASIRRQHEAVRDG
jgi:UDPglucose 6-dehydrogenase